MVGISLADIAALNADGLRQPEVMLTDDIAIGNNAVILFPVPLGQAGDTAAIRVVDVVEPAAGIVVEHIHAVCVGGKDDDVDFISGRIIVICVSGAIADADTLVAQLELCKTELTVEVGIRGGEQIHLRMVIHRLAEYIKRLRFQLELQHLRGQLVISALVLCLLDEAANHFYDFIHNIIGGRGLKAGLRQEPGEAEQRFQIVVDSDPAHVVGQKTSIIDGLYDGLSVKLRLFGNVFRSRLRFRCTGRLCPCSSSICRRFAAHATHRAYGIRGTGSRCRWCAE